MATPPKTYLLKIVFVKTRQDIRKFGHTCKRLYFTHMITHAHAHAHAHAHTPLVFIVSKQVIKRKHKMIVVYFGVPDRATTDPSPTRLAHRNINSTGHTGNTSCLEHIRHPPHLAQTMLYTRC